MGKLGGCLVPSQAAAVPVVEAWDKSNKFLWKANKSVWRCLVSSQAAAIMPFGIVEQNAHVSQRKRL